MATVKVTFTLDRATVARLRQAADRLAKPQSQVVREAIRDYHARIGKLSEEERRLRVLDRMMARPPSRSQAEVDEEIRAIRQARRAGGRRSPQETAR